jgi:gamma-glutamylcyclotransferase
MIKYFAYGSNLHPIRLKHRVPESEFLFIATLKAYQLNFHKRSSDGSAKANAFFTGNDDDMIHGAVYHMPSDKRYLLDHHEGLGNGYEVELLEVFASDKYKNDVLRDKAALCASSGKVR